MTALSFASLLAACGSDDGIEGGGGDQSAEIDADPEGRDRRSVQLLELAATTSTRTKPTSLDDFEKEYGTKVKYTEEINDNNEFFGKVRQIYDSGDSGGRDMHVVTDWMASKMKQLGYVQKLDKSELPNVDANLIDSLKSPSFDPEREWSVPWQCGIRGDRLPQGPGRRPPESVNDLFDPKFKGKVTMLTEMRDTVGLDDARRWARIRRRTARTPALEAIEKIEEAQKSGQIRRFTGNDYIARPHQGRRRDVASCWSGDAISLRAANENLDVVLPPEGFMLFSDNMQIPVGAPHAYTAQKFMDFVYQPEIAAKIAAYVNYITPVKGAQEELRKIDPELAESPYIFPSDELLDRSYIFRELDADEERELQEAFQRAIGA